MSMPLIACVSVPPRPSQKRVLVEDLARPLGFDGGRPAVQRLELGERGADEVDVGERAAVRRPGPPRSRPRRACGPNRRAGAPLLQPPSGVAPYRPTATISRILTGAIHRRALAGRGRTPYLGREYSSTRGVNGTSSSSGKIGRGQRAWPRLRRFALVEPGRIDVDHPGGPVAEEARLAMRRLDDDGVEVARVLAVGEEQRAVVEHDRPAGGHDRQRLVLEDRGRARPPLEAVGLARRTARRSARRRVPSNGIGSNRPGSSRPPMVVRSRAADARPQRSPRPPGSTIGARTVPVVAAVGEGAQDRVAVARRARARRVGGVGQDDRALGASRRASATASSQRR